MTPHVYRMWRLYLQSLAVTLVHHVISSSVWSGSHPLCVDDALVLSSHATRPLPRLLIQAVLLCRPALFLQLHHLQDEQKQLITMTHGHNRSSSWYIRSYGDRFVPNKPWKLQSRSYYLLRLIFFSFHNKMSLSLNDLTLKQLLLFGKIMSKTKHCLCTF